MSPATTPRHVSAPGYLPESIRNYLARLSWSHGDDEIFSTEHAIEWFLGMVEMAVSLNFGAALLFGVYFRTLGFWKLPNGRINAQA